MKVLVAQTCPTLCDPTDCKNRVLPRERTGHRKHPGSSVHGVLQARILEWVAIPFFGGLPNPGPEPRSPALQVKAGSLPAEPAKNN